MKIKPRILYIDDEADLLDLAVSFFEEENLPIHTSTNIQKALEMMKAHEYDLIITDVRMPRGTGFELLNKIRNEGHYKGKVILVTGNVDTIEENDKKKCDLVLFKPIRFQELIDKVKALLDS